MKRKAMPADELPPAGSRNVSLVNGRNKRFAGFVTGLGILIAFGHLLAALFPSARTWGFHHLGFFPFAPRIGVPLIMGVMLIPWVQRIILTWIQRTADWSRRRPMPQRVFLIVLLLTALALLFWSLRQRTFFLGDGYLTTRNLSGVESAEGVPFGFQNAPLPGFLAWKVSQFLSGQEVTEYTHTAFQVVSIALGLGCLLVIFGLSRHLARDPIDRTLAALFIVSGGAIQLSFGYVETYMPAYLALLLFLWLALAHLKSGMPLVFPSMAFGVLLSCHFGMVWMVPGLLYLWYGAFRKRDFPDLALSMAGLGGTVMLLLWTSGYTLDLLRHVLSQEGGRSFLPLSGQPDAWQAYTMLSPMHFLDLANLHLLYSPFALPVLITLAVFRPEGVLRSDPGAKLLLFVILAGMCFTFLMSFSLGMSRDWDVASLYIPGVVLGACFLWNTVLDERELRRRMMVAMTGITMMHSAVWVAINADVERSVARFGMLQEQGVWSKGAIAYAQEDLAGFYRDRGDYNRAIEHYSRSLHTDSTNSRRWAGLGDMYEKIKQLDRAVRAYEKAIKCGTTQSWVYGNLGAEYINRGRFDEAADVLRKGLAIDPELPMAAYNLGTLLSTKQEKYEEGLEYLLQAIKTDPEFADAYQNAGTCCYYLGKYPEMILYYEKFLELAPDDPAAGPIRELLESVERP